jgi:hypothetical protein
VSTRDKISSCLQVGIVTYFVLGSLHHPSAHAVCLQALQRLRSGILARPGGQVDIAAILMLQTAC